MSTSFFLRQQFFQILRSSSPYGALDPRPDQFGGPSTICCRSPFHLSAEHEVFHPSFLTFASSIIADTGSLLPLHEELSWRLLLSTYVAGFSVFFFFPHVLPAFVFGPACWLPPSSLGRVLTLCPCFSHLSFGGNWQFCNQPLLSFPAIHPRPSSQLEQMLQFFPLSSPPITSFCD